MEVIEVKDYIANPKRNGYKSLHMIIKYPLSLNSGTKDVFAEIQLRTLAMDFWASLEHKLYYKYEGKIPEYLKDELHDAAMKAEDLDNKMAQSVKILMILRHAQIKLCYHYKKVLANENLFLPFWEVRLLHLLKFHVIFLYCSNLFNLPFILFFSKGILYFLLKSDTVVYFLFFRFNNNIPYFTNFHIYMFQFNFLISLLKCGFFLCFKSSALGIFFENNSICSARFFHSSFAQMYE